MKIVMLTVTLLLLACSSSKTSLSGKFYKGVAGQGGTPQLGCEGCGNPGFIQFVDATTMDVNRPGDDQVFRLSYSYIGSTITTDKGDVLTVSEDLKSLAATYGTFLFEEAGQ